TRRQTGSTPDQTSFASSDALGKTVLLTAGGYSVSDGGVTGYTQTSASADCSGTIAAGETRTCTIVNDDVQPKLIVIQHVINDNGGTATAASFTTSVTGSSPSPARIPGAEGNGVKVGRGRGID